MINIDGYNLIFLHISFFGFLFLSIDEKKCKTILLTHFLKRHVRRQMISQNSHHKGFIKITITQCESILLSMPQKEFSYYYKKAITIRTIKHATVIFCYYSSSWRIWITILHERPPPEPVNYIVLPHVLCFRGLAVPWSNWWNVNNKRRASNTSAEHCQVHKQFCNITSLM